MLRVVVERAGEILHDATFRQTLISCGRDGGNDLVIDDPYVSAQHVLIRKDSDGGWFRLIDHSVNGITWEGEKIKTLRFDRPTVVRINDFSLTLLPLTSSGTAELSGVDLHGPTVVEELPDRSGLRSTMERPSGLISPREDLEAELRSISRDGELKMIVFSGQAIIGRSPDCDLQFTSRDISRRHCLITAQRDGFFLRRLAEKNNLELNHREVHRGQSVRLNDGDVIRLCDEEIVFLHPATQPRVLAPSIPFEAASNVDLAVTRRGCADPSVDAFDLAGFLGAKTAMKFEDELMRNFTRSRLILLDMGYLIGMDGVGVASLSRMISEAERLGIEIQIIRVTPRIADLLSFSALKQVLSRYISSSEDTAIKKLRSV